MPHILIQNNVFRVKYSVSSELSANSLSKSRTYNRPLNGCCIVNKPLKKSHTENLERIAIAASAFGTLVSALSSQAVYAAMPITFALFLNLVNRNDIKKQTQNSVNISLLGTKNDILSKVGRKMEEVPDLTENVESLTDKLNDISINLGNHQHQSQNNFDSLNS